MPGFPSPGHGCSIIGQFEVGHHVHSFANGVHSALRRKLNIIIVGEARNFETISASLTGHLVYTTIHSGGVSDTIRRLLATFPTNERDSRAYDLATTPRKIVVQYLVRKNDGSGRLPVREFRRFDIATRKEPIETGVEN